MSPKVIGKCSLALKYDGRYYSGDWLSPQGKLDKDGGWGPGSIDWASTPKPRPVNGEPEAKGANSCMVCFAPIASGLQSCGYCAHVKSEPRSHVMTDGPNGARREHRIASLAASPDPLDRLAASRARRSLLLEEKGRPRSQASSHPPSFPEGAHFDAEENYSTHGSSGR